MPAAITTVALTGGSGFVGRHLLRQLLDAGFAVRALMREPARAPLNHDKLTSVRGDLANPASLRELVTGCQAVIHLVGIIEEKHGQTFESVHTEGTRRMLEATRSAGSVAKWVQMSALGVRPHAVARYHKSKWEAEQLVRQSGLDYTIIRPSIIHGPDGEFMQLLRGFWCDAFPPFVPFFSGRLRFGDYVAVKKALLWPFPALKHVEPAATPIPYTSKAPAGRLQPVWVEDVAACFVRALTEPRASREVYPLGGPEAFTWPRLLKLVRDVLPRVRNKPICAFPVWYAKLIAGLPGVPFNLDQVIMSQEDSTCSIGKVEAELGVKPAAFEATLRDYAAKLADK